MHIHTHIYGYLNLCVYTYDIRLCIRYWICVSVDISYSFYKLGIYFIDLITSRLYIFIVSHIVLQAYHVYLQK